MSIYPKAKRSFRSRKMMSHHSIFFDREAQAYLCLSFFVFMCLFLQKHFPQFNIIWYILIGIIKLIHFFIYIRSERRWERMRIDEELSYENDRHASCSYSSFRMDGQRYLGMTAYWFGLQTMVHSRRQAVILLAAQARKMTRTGSKPLHS